MRINGAEADGLFVRMDCLEKILVYKTPIIGIIMLDMDIIL